MKKQCVDILQHMEINGSITDLEAYMIYHIRRLASRVHDLKKMYGYNVGSVWETSVNAAGEPVRYKRYFLIKGESE